MTQIQFQVVRGKRSGARLSAGISTHLVKADDPKITLCGLDVLCHVNSMTIGCSCKKCSRKMAEMQAEEIKAKISTEKKIIGFEKGRNRGTRRCSNCQKNTWQDRIHEMGGGYNLCDDCYDEAGLENEHQDGYHSADSNGPDENCPMCQSEQIAKRIEEIRDQDKKDKESLAKLPQYLIERKPISRKTSQILFIDLETGEAHYKHQLFDRTYRYKVIAVKNDCIYGIRVTPDGKQYQGPKGDERFLITLKSLENSPYWSAEEAN